MSFIVKTEDTAEIATPETHYTVLDQDITLKTRETPSDDTSQLYHHSPKSNSQQKAGDETLALGKSPPLSLTHTADDLHTAFAAKLKLDSPDTEIVDLGGTELPSASSTFDLVEENSCKAAKSAPLDPQKLAKEIDEFFAQEASHTAVLPRREVTSNCGHYCQNINL